MAPGAGPAALLAALEGLGEQVAELRLPLEVAGAEQARTLSRETADQLDRLRAATAAPAGRAAAGGRGRPDRRRQVDVGQQPGRCADQRGRSPAADHPLRGHRLPPQDNAWFEEPRILPGLTRTTSSSTDPTSLQLVPSRGIPIGPRRARCAGHRLGRHPQPRARDPAARRGGHVAVRHDGGALRRRRALGVPPHRPSPGAPRWPSCSTGFRRRRSTRCAATWPRCSPTRVWAAPRCSWSRRPRRTTRSCRPTSSTRSAAGCTGSPPTPTPGRPSCGTRSTARCARWPPGCSPWPPRPTRRPRRSLGCAGGRRGVRRGACARSTEASSDGSLLRGEVLARWQEFVGTGEIMRALESKVSRVRDRVTAEVQGKPAPGDELAEALETGVEALVRSAADAAAERAGTAWAADPAGAAAARRRRPPASVTGAGRRRRARDGPRVAGRRARPGAQPGPGQAQRCALPRLRHQRARPDGR